MKGIHAEFSLTLNIYCLILIQDIFSGVINTKQKIIALKLWERIQRYTTVDFQDWSSMTLTINMAYISIFRSRFQNVFDSHL